MVPITVFTPTYNRATLLTRCFESMKRQSNKNFIWLIVDDGSTDDTELLVQSWIKETTDFKIEYYYKENGGLHTAYNTAIANIRTELSVCIDSDDYLPDNAIEVILDFWETNGSECVAGIVGLDYTITGDLIGDYLPEQKTVNLIDLLTGKYRIHNGDRTNVVRTELYKKVAPMKVFPGEKNFNPHYMHLQISKDYDFLVLNRNLRYVEYQADGMTSNMLRQYMNSPNSFLETRKLYLSFDNTSPLFKLRHCIHYVSSCCLAKKEKLILQSPRPILTLLAIPAGLMLALYIKLKTK